ncbi:MAG: choice-of-anchor D domain-containing protein [Bdellovibrionales bacterium]|nr:choice-of-anchor D domain-containing protein [Bdellovibrionales bacterium]
MRYVGAGARWATSYVFPALAILCIGASGCIRFNNEKAAQGGSPNPVAEVTGSPATKAHGIRMVGSSDPQIYTLTNDGDGPATDVFLSLSGTGFALSANDCGTSGARVLIATGATCTFTVTFAPTAAGAAAATATFSYFDGNTAQNGAITITGTAYTSAMLLLEPGATLAFQTINTNASWRETVSVRNYSPGSIATLGAVDSASLGLASPFTVVAGGTCAASMSLAYGQGCSLVIEYLPLIAGPDTDQLQLSYDDGFAPATSSIDILGTTSDPNPGTEYAFLGLAFDGMSFSTDDSARAGGSDFPGMGLAVGFARGAFQGPTGALYVAVLDHVERFDPQSGAFMGWVGRVHRPFNMGGAAGCESLTQGQITPGWCTGGANYSSGDGDYSNGQMSVPVSTWADATSVYVASKYGINRFNAATGAFSGWIGRVQSVAGISDGTGGPGGCATTVIGDMTPGWCVNGQAQLPASNTQAGTFGGLGAINQADGAGTIFGDGTYLYVALPDGLRVERFRIDTGANAGWIGGLAAVGGGTCTGTVGGFNGGWCQGGTSQAGVTDGMMTSPKGVFSDDTYLYVGDSGSFRLLRFNKATGLFSGWVGRIATTPASDADGTTPGACGVAGVGTQTPGWCLGGTAQGGNVTSGGVNSGLYSTSSALAGDDGYLYVTSTQGDEGPSVSRFAKATGAFAGWIGVVGSTPPTGCGATVDGQNTPGWCMGGSISSSRGSPDGTGRWATPSFVSVGGTSLFVSEVDNGRINRFDTATGVFTGTLAAHATDRGWRTTGFGVKNRGYYWAAPVTDADLGEEAMSMFSDGTWLYVGVGNPRISRFSLATGNADGWVGSVGYVPPTGDATGGAGGCTSATTLGQPAPGWCSGGGGLSQSLATRDGAFYGAAHGISIQGSYLYATDAEAGKILRFDASTGAPAGRIGQWGGHSGGNEPTGGAVGCTTLSGAGGVIMPGWCTGGIEIAYGNHNGTGDGALTISSDQTRTAIVSDATYLYVGDAGNFRIQRFDLATGAAAGWVGRTNSTAGMSDAAGSPGGCAAAPAHTPGWCLGGTSRRAQVDGFNQPYGEGGLDTISAMAIDANYLYVFDDLRIVRFDKASGAFEGWTGDATTIPPTDTHADHPGGAGTCQGLSDQDPTGGWCIGGTAHRWGYLSNNAAGLVAGGGYLYTARYQDISRWNATTGSVNGWKGVVGTLPSGGTGSCLTAAVGDLVMDGWCTGGAGTNNAPHLAATFTDVLNGMAIDASYLYVYLSSVNQIMRVPR